MQWLFFIIFGGLFLFFVGYGIYLVKKDKKIINEISNKANGRLLGGSDISEEEMDFFDCERPFVDSYQSPN